MAVRIYAFAKDLGLENKELLDICEKLGIKGKGSALANLDDDEISKIKKFLAGESESPAAAPAVEEAPPTPEVTAAAPEVAAATVAATAAAPVEPPLVSRKPATPAAPLSPAAPRREERTPARGAPLQDLDQMARKKAAGGEDKPAAKRDPMKRRSGSNIPLAAIVAMPEVKQPTPQSTQETIKVQKPDIALPQEALLKARRTGSVAPLEEFTAKSKSKTTPAKPPRKGPPRPQDVAEAELAAAREAAGKARAKKEKGTGPGFDSELGATRQVRKKIKEKGAFDGRRDPLDEEGLERQRQYRRRIQLAAGSTAAPRKDKILLQLPCTVRTFSEAAGVNKGLVLMALPKLGDAGLKNINSELSPELVELLIEHLNLSHMVELRQAESLEEKVLSSIDTAIDSATATTRPPVVTFLGHVDHGKTSLLDAIIGTDVVSGEAGGITQHIRAYQVRKGDRKISFVDTPGHEAFTEMRARGANVTDIAVLVIAADDGIKPQTEEAISHAKAAGVPIIVALNKIDLPGANPEKVYQELASRNLLPSEWGGDVEVVKTSAVKKTGIDELLETILVTAELHEYKANVDRAAFGTCLEAEQQPGRGVIAKLIVGGGTLNVGDIVVCGAAHGRVKAMYDTLQARKKVSNAGPSMPVNVTGLDIAPNAGDKFYVLSDIAEARELAASREATSRQQSLGGITTRVSLEDFQKRVETGTLGKTQDVVTLNLIIRADVRGSIEALQKELSKIEHPEVRVNILQALVGGVTLADVRLAQASQAVIIGFNVVPDEAARSLADDLQVEIRRYDIIYKVADDIKATLEGRLKPEQQVVEVGMAMVLQAFSISKVGAIAGCRVMRGSIQRDCKLRVIRDSRVIGEYPIESLKREKDDAREVQRGMECGIKLQGFNDIKEGDTLEAFKIQEVARTL